MKKIFFLLFAFVVAQEAKGQILIGPVVGPQISWVSFDDKESGNSYRKYPSYGFHAGFGVSFRVRKRFFLHTNLLYSSKGEKREGKDDALLDFKSKYNYIDLPMAYTVEFTGKVSKLKQYKWYFGLGPHVSYWLGGKGHLENSQLSEVLIDRVDYRIVYNREENDYSNNQMNVNDPNRLQLGLNIQAGLAFEPLGYQKVMVNLRYELGHSFLSAENKGTFRQTNEFQDDLRVRIQGFRLSFAYLIDLKTEESKKGKSTINKKKLK